MMCPSPESAAPIEFSDITTIGQAAIELTRLHGVLYEQAKEYRLIQPDQLPQGFNEDWTWDQGKGSFVPKLKPVQRRHEVIELGAHQGAFSNIEAEYDLRTTPGGELIIQRYGQSIDPGDRYKTNGSQLWRAERIPFSAGAAMKGEQGFDPLVAHLWLTSEYTNLVEVDNSVLALILDLRSYEVPE
jgi:hypothetical protein